MALPATAPTDTPVVARWSILSDDPTLAELSCRFAPDVLAPDVGQDVPCAVGVNELALQGYPTGVYESELTLSRNGTSFRRRSDIVAGTPPAVTELGALAAGDPFDPDYTPEHYYIDHYEVTGLSGTRAFAIEASTNDFGMYLGLYDRVRRNASTGGGLLRYAVAGVDGKARMVVVPEAGRHYVIGVSSYEADVVGSYELSLVNDGALTPR